ncbi:MAG: hypothetical protein ACPKPY_10680 [Nitrososphaeraceae archaeon]
MHNIFRLRQVYDDPVLMEFHYFTICHLIIIVCTLFNADQNNTKLIEIDVYIYDEYNKFLEEKTILAV